MGLLSDPTLTPRRNLAKSLNKHSGKICFLLYAAGIGWYFCLALPAFLHNTYLSENALSPGLVYAESKFDSSMLAQDYLKELNREREKHDMDLPIAWISAKMKQIGLETYVHNYSLHFPLSKRVYNGYNVYGILRAAGTGSTEGIVFSVPYRPPVTVNVDITPSVPVLLAFAEFARKKNYWAKDLIFLVSDQEMLGTEAWLKAYYEEDLSLKREVLNPGYLPARAGALQAAINLEIQDLDYEAVNVKIEGLNGQLPNLDLFNLVQRIMSREGVSSGYKHQKRTRRYGGQATYKDNVKFMTNMLLTQATCVPTGAHGLFNRYRIEALTLEFIKNSGSSKNINSSTLSLLKIIEGISRSLNNLLERFHQSFFFYILVQNDQFVSIGDYIPTLCLMIAPNFVKAMLIWLTCNIEENDSKKTKKNAAKDYDDIEEYFKKITISFILAFGSGFLANALYFSADFRQIVASFPYSTSHLILSVTLTTFVASLFLPIAVKLNDKQRNILHSTALICLGVCLIVVGLLNFALGFLLGIICTPLSFLIETRSKSALRKYLSKIYLFLINPFFIIYAFSLYHVLQEYPDLDFLKCLSKAAFVGMDAVTFALFDNLIYGTWLFTAITIGFYPQWLLNWIVLFARTSSN